MKFRVPLAVCCLSLLALWLVGQSLAEPRSGKWAGVRDAYLELHPHCEFKGCKNRDTPEVHHVLSFSRHPERELDPTNLISLCRTGDNHHLYVGHLGRFIEENPDVREHCRLGVYPAKGLQRKQRHDAKKRKTTQAI